MKYLSLLSILIFLGCSNRKLPTERLYQYDHDHCYEFNGDELKVELVNTLRCPMRIWIQSDDDSIGAHFDTINPFTLGPLQDTLITAVISGVQIKEVHFASRFGDVNEVVDIRKVELPFQKNKEYALVQGNNSLPSHNTDESRYAFDFGLPVGDTICAATNGFVVGVIEDYRFGGRQEKWRDFANLITVYNPETAMFVQYVHLDYKGSLVNLGDSVWTGQKIAIAGMTGFTNIEHLHFNCLRPIHSEHGLTSIPLDSIGPYEVSGLRRNQKMIYTD